MPDDRAGRVGADSSAVHGRFGLLAQHFRAPARKRLAAEIELLQSKSAVTVVRKEPCVQTDRNGVGFQSNRPGA